MAAIRQDWLSKSLAGAVLGLGLAFAVAGVFAWAAPDGPNKYQLAMWLVAPLWLAVASVCFLFRSGMRAWLWLGGANVVAYAVLHLCRHFAR